MLLPVGIVFTSQKRGGQEKVDTMLLRGGKGGREDSRNHFPSLPDVLQVTTPPQ